MAGMLPTAFCERRMADMRLSRLLARNARRIISPAAGAWVSHPPR
jgi:hypothetical protein